jgi:hypothetical protein
MYRADQIIAHALANPVNAHVLATLEQLNIPDAWLVSGCVFQSVWNALTGRPPEYGILDYDVFYFDPDVSYEAEDAVIRRCATAFADLRADIQVRNQARVHLWYPRKFGRPYPTLTHATDGLTRFLAPCCSVGIRLEQGRVRLAAPFGVDDLMRMTIRPNLAIDGPPEQYNLKSARWAALWPEVTVLPWLH